MRITQSCPSLLKAILQGRSGCQINVKSMLGGEKQSDRRKAKTLELNGAARSAPAESQRLNRALIVQGRHHRDLPHSHLIHRPSFVQSYEEHILLLLNPEMRKKKTPLEIQWKQHLSLVLKQNALL